MKSISAFMQLTISSTIFISCSKQDNVPVNKPARIDVYNPYGADANGNLLYGNLADSQWQRKTFSKEEMNLFASLDTADLAGTSTPDSVNQYSKTPFNTIFCAMPGPILSPPIFTLIHILTKALKGK